MRGFVNIYFNSENSAGPTAIINAIRQVANVVTAHIVAGDVDAIAYVEAPSSNDFLNTVVAIRQVKGVGRTSTIMAF